MEDIRIEVLYCMMFGRLDSSLEVFCCVKTGGAGSSSQQKSESPLPSGPSVTLVMLQQGLGVAVMVESSRSVSVMVD